MNELLGHPWVRVLIIATTVAMCSLALRETASVTLPIISALREVLVPVAIGFTIAYVLTPVVDILHRRGLPRYLAAAVLFAVFSVVMVVGISLVVPTVLRQSTGMAARLFQGERFTDLNGNTRYDDGEPFNDTNGNGRYDSQGMLATGLNWLEERQGQLRRIAKLELDQPSLGFLAYYQEQTAGERALIDAALAAARDGRPIDQWPALMRRDPPVDAPLAWSREWPGTTRVAVDDAFTKLVPEMRERWIRNLACAGRAYAAHHAESLALLRALRRNEALPTGPLEVDRASRARFFMQGPLSSEVEAASKSFAQRLTEEEKAEFPAAHHGKRHHPGDRRGAVAERERYSHTSFGHRRHPQNRSGSVGCDQPAICSRKPGYGWDG